MPEYDRAIHPELRAAGRIARLLLPRHTERTFRVCRRLMKPLKGVHRLKCEEKHIMRSDGTALRLCVYRPSGVQPHPPGLLWIHGGGYAIGLPETDEGFVKRFMKTRDCLIVSPDYRLSGDAPYPAALEDCRLALNWLSAQGVSPLIVGGESAGGGLAAALCIDARDRGEIAVDAQLLVYPMLDDRAMTPAARDENVPVWNALSNVCAWKQYLGTLYGTEDIPASAVPARLRDFRSLPPMFSYVGSVDIFRDETLLYAENIRRAGGQAECRVFDGCFHGFDILCGFAAPAREARTLLCRRFAHEIDRLKNNA